MRTSPFSRWILPTLFILSLINLFPLLVMVVASFFPGQTLAQKGGFLSLFRQGMTLENYRHLLSGGQLIEWCRNSLVVSLIVTFSHLFFDSLGGYCLAHGAFRGRKLAFTLVIGCMLVPTQILLVPLYILCMQMNLIDSPLALILPFLISPFGLFIMRQHILEIPKSLIESARMDGAGEWVIFRDIILPLCKPMLGPLGIFVFLGHWNSFLWPLVAIHSPRYITLPVGLSLLQGRELLNYPLVLTGATLSTIPMVVVFLLFSSLFLKGMTEGGVKE